MKNFYFSGVSVSEYFFAKFDKYLRMLLVSKIFLNRDLLV
jgi:hypothetical protein